MFGERGKFILSGGNDKSVKLWDCFKSIDAGQISSGNDLLTLNINTSKKVSYNFFPSTYMFLTCG